MSEADVKLRDLMLIVLSPDRYPTAHRISQASLTASFAMENEEFCEITNDDFFGFYDWLRPEKGRIVGLYVHLDETDGRDLGISELMGVETISPPEWDGEKNLKIWFGRQSEVDDSLSCDQDFGDNGIFHGSKGSVALVFNAPPDTDIIVQHQVA